MSSQSPSRHTRAALPSPTRATLADAGRAFARLGAVDRSWHQLQVDTSGAVDLSLPGHRALLHRWLNSWGCRLPYPRNGGTAVLETELARWWEAHGDALPRRRLAALTDADLAALARAFDDLAGCDAGNDDRRRTLGATAASKALYALRPGAGMPWDAAIAIRLHGGRDGAHYERHLRLGRQWARSLLTDTGLTEAELADHCGRPGISLAKVLDEYCYLALTRS